MVSKPRRRPEVTNQVRSRPKKQGIVTSADIARDLGLDERTVRGRIVAAFQALTIPPDKFMVGRIREIPELAAPGLKHLIDAKRSLMINRLANGAEPGLYPSDMGAQRRLAETLLFLSFADDCAEGRELADLMTRLLEKFSQAAASEELSTLLIMLHNVEAVLDRHLSPSTASSHTF